MDDIKNNPVFKKRNLDEEDIPNTKTVMVEQQLRTSRFHYLMKRYAKVK